MKQKSAVFTDYSGVGVNDMIKLRNELRSKGVEYKIAKKTLLQRAIKNAGIEGFDIIGMAGQIGVGFGYKDEVSGPKVLAEFAKKRKTFKILSGILSKKMLGAQDVLNLAKLPSLDGLRARLVGVMSAPMRNFASVLNANLRNLVCVLSQINQNKS